MTKHIRTAIVVALLALIHQTALAAAPPNATARTGALRAGREPVKLTLDVTGASTLVLSVSGRFGGQAVWGEAVLIGCDGSQARLADLKPVSANVPLTQKPAKVGKTQFSHGVGANGFSFIEYVLAGKFVRFEAMVGLAGADDKRSTAVFEARNGEGFAWQRTLEQLKRGFTRECFASLRRTAREAKADALDRRAQQRQLPALPRRASRTCRRARPSSRGQQGQRVHRLPHAHHALRGHGPQRPLDAAAHARHDAGL